MLSTGLEPGHILSRFLVCSITIEENVSPLVLVCIVLAIWLQSEGCDYVEFY